MFVNKSGMYIINNFAASGSQNCLRIIKDTKNKLAAIKDEQIKESFTKLYEKIINNSSNIENNSDYIYTLSQKVEMIENPVIKQKVLKIINDLSLHNSKKFRKLFEDNITDAENYTDCVNILNGKYANTDSNPIRYYRWLKKGNSWMADVLENKIGTPENYRKNYVTQPKKVMSYNEYRQNIDNVSDKKLNETFQNSIRDEQFKKFASLYNDSSPSMVNYIYHQEYLKNINPKTKKILETINKEYGTMVFPTNADLNDKDFKYLEEELKLWKETGGKNTRLPQIIDINSTDYTLGQSDSIGSTSYLYNKIKLDGLLKTDTECGGSTLRHELNHINDEKYEYESITPTTQFVRDIKWKVNKLLHKKQWKKEMKNAGLNNEDIEYALTYPRELKSVSVEGDCSKYSKEYKDTLVKKFKLQQWILNLPQNSYLKKCE